MLNRFDIEIIILKQPFFQLVTGGASHLDSDKIEWKVTVTVGENGQGQGQGGRNALPCPLIGVQQPIR